MNLAARLPRSTKRLAGAALRQPTLNAAVRALLRPIAGLFPVESLARIPLVGTATVMLPGGAAMRLASDGRDLVASALAWRGLAGWEPETFAVLERLLPHVAVLFDVGASTGVFTLRAALDDPRRRVFAFEPSPRMLDALSANVALNRLTNVVTVGAAVADHDGDADLFIPAGDSMPFGASTLATFRRPEASVRVPALRLDTFVERESVARVDLIKLDTEGTEPSALAGARSLLRRDEPWIICEVLHGLTEAGLHEALDAIGYRYFAITRTGLEARPRIAGDPTYRERNWLFATPRRLADLPLPG